MTVIYRYLDCGDLLLALQGCAVKNVAMKIYWLFPVSEDTFVPPVIRKGLLNMVNGCLPMF